MVLARVPAAARSLAAFFRTFLAGWDGCSSLEFPQFSERDVAADLVTLLLFEQRGVRWIRKMPVGSRRGHRVWNTQPAGGSAADGISPVSRIRDGRWPPSDGTAENSASVYG